MLFRIYHLLAPTSVLRSPFPFFPPPFAPSSLAFCSSSPSDFSESFSTSREFLLNFPGDLPFFFYPVHLLPGLSSFFYLPRTQRPFLLSHSSPAVLHPYSRVRCGYFSTSITFQHAFVYQFLFR